MVDDYESIRLPNGPWRLSSELLDTQTDDNEQDTRVAY